MIEANILEKFEKIKLLILDVDGILTDGRIIFSPQGDEFKVFNVKDGVAIKNLMKNNIDVAIISGRKSPAVTHRMQELGVQYIFLGQNDKLAAYQNIKNTLHLEDHQIACMGDDLPDLTIMQPCGLSITVADAVDEVKAVADFISTRNGGDAAVREVSDLLLKVQQSKVAA